MLTRDDVAALLAHLGQPITPATWSSMVARHQAPEPDERVGRTPLWAEDTIREWAASRPGQGRRSDRQDHHKIRTDDHRVICSCGKSSPDYEAHGYELADDVLDRIAAEWAWGHGVRTRQLWRHSIVVIGPHEEIDGMVRRAVDGPYEAAVVMARGPQHAAACYWGPDARVGSGHASVGGVGDYLVHLNGRHVGYVEDYTERA